MRIPAHGTGSEELGSINGARVFVGRGEVCSMDVAVRVLQNVSGVQCIHIMMWVVNEFNYACHLHHLTWMAFTLVPADAAAINP